MTAVLVVDDDRAAAMALRIHLGHAGIDAGIATSGLEALSKFDTDCPRVVLLDASMPGLNGLKVCERIKSGPRGRETTVIMVSGASTPSPHYVRQCAEITEADAFVRKPYEHQQLVAMVGEALDRVPERVG